MLTSICVQQVLGALQEKEQSKHQRQQQNDSSRRTPTCFTGSQNTAGHTGQQVLATERFRQPKRSHTPLDAPRSAHTHTLTWHSSKMMSASSPFRFGPCSHSLIWFSLLPCADSESMRCCLSASFLAADIARLAACMQAHRRRSLCECRCLVSTSMAHRHIVPPFTEGCRKPIACLKIEM
eukprot:scaffold315569_cov19-Tisochrysis_lutea.AAC.3